MPYHREETGDLQKTRELKVDKKIISPHPNRAMAAVANVPVDSVEQPDNAIPLLDDRQGHSSRSENSRLGQSGGK